MQAKVINLKKIHSKIQSPQQYLKVVKFGLTRLSQFKASVTTKLPKVKIGGLKFSQMAVAMKIGSMKVTQHYYAAKRDNYLLMFMTSYVNTDDGKIMKGIVDSAKFS